MTDEMRQARVLDEAINCAARKVHRLYRLAETEDLRQEIWAAVIADRERFHELALGPPRVLGAALKGIAWKCAKQDERTRRAEKAALGGYETEDECFYSRRQLRELIPMYLDGGVSEHPPHGREMARDVTADPATGGNHLAAMIDVDRAFGGLRRHHADILRRYFRFPRGSGGWTHEEVAAHLGIDPVALRGRVERALIALQGELGGVSPWNRGPAPGAHRRTGATADLAVVVIMPRVDDGHDAPDRDRPAEGNGYEHRSHGMSLLPRGSCNPPGGAPASGYDRTGTHPVRTAYHLPGSAVA